MQQLGWISKAFAKLRKPAFHLDDNLEKTELVPEKSHWLPGVEGGHDCIGIAQGSLGRSDILIVVMGTQNYTFQKLILKVKEMVALQAPLSMEFSRQELLEWIAISFSRGYSQPRAQT